MGKGVSTTPYSYSGREAAPSSCTTTSASTTVDSTDHNAASAARLEWSLHDPDTACRSGYGAQRGLVGTHIDALPAAAWPGLCSNRSVLLLHGPGIRTGHRIRNARTIDVAPTLAHITGMAPQQQTEGGVLSQVFG